MKNPFTLHTPPSFQHYDCRMCGACCRAGFAVFVTDEERERIQGQGWEDDPEFPYRDRKLFIRQLDGSYILNQGDDGACIFLNEQNSCRIHARYGEPAKPFACRPYPFVIFPTGRELRTSLRFDCPAVCENEGRPLPEHLPGIETLAELSIPHEALQLSPPPFRQGIALNWAELSRVAEAYEHILATDSLDLTRRVLACADLTGLLAGARIDDLNGRRLDTFVSVLVENRIRCLAQDPLERRKPRGMLPVMFRQALGLYGRLDRTADMHVSLTGKAARLLQRLTYSLRLVSGAGSMPRVRPDLPRVSFRRLEQAFGIPDAEAAAVLTRYYRVKLNSLGFCGRAFYDWGFLDGMGALLLTYPLILWYARLFAAGEGKTSLVAAVIRHAVRVVDRARGITISLNMPTERVRQRFLSDHENLSRLILWYGT
ncbi:MAG TPA: YkgJ family cysteine cluster protein [Armatimonadota bacterium]|nr:YkgJ family cysteine cluster protein [Armatimonadota bacterium]